MRRPRSAPVPARGEGGEPVSRAARTAVCAGAVAAGLLAVGTLQARAQAVSADERAVVEVIERFFEGMLQRDTAMMRSTIDPSARLVGVVVRDGQAVVRASALDGFLASVARGQGEAANERIFAPEVRIDGDLAQVWTFYTLHIGERFSHCGYDAFHLLRTAGEWKIVNIADTRRTERCEPPRR